MGVDVRKGRFQVQHVLVVDDDAAIRGTLRWALGDAGYAVDEAQDGIRALTLLRKHRE